MTMDLNLVGPHNPLFKKEFLYVLPLVSLKQDDSLSLGHLYLSTAVQDLSEVPDDFLEIDVFWHVFHDCVGFSSRSLLHSDVHHFGGSLNVSF